MIKIKSVAIEKYNLTLQILCAALIIAACFLSKILMIAAALVAVIYLFSNEKWEQKFAFFMFLLSFSPIFKLQSGQTSLFMVLRISVVLCYLFKEQKKFSFVFFGIVVAFFSYSVIISEIFHTDYYVSLINIVLWILISYIIINTLKENKTSPVVRSLSNGVIITGIIGIFAESFPQIMENITIITIYAQDGALISRYSGFWGDPNFYSVTIAASLCLLYCEFNRNRIGVTEFLIRCLSASFLGLLTMSKSCLLILVLFWAYVFIVKNDIQTTAKIVLFFTLIIAIGVFIYKNPYWFSDILYRFTGDSSNIDADILTTGRTSLWETYYNHMINNANWLYGNGVGAELLNKIATHNTLLQILYNVGLTGLILYVSMFRSVYVSVGRRMLKKGSNTPAKFSFFAILFLYMFLDGFLNEMFYYILPLIFVYILDVKDVNDESIENLSENNAIVR